MQLAGRKPFIIRTRARRVLLIGAAIFVIAAVWAGSYAYHVYSGLTKITHVTVPRSTAEPAFQIPPVDSSKRINFLVLGSDNDKKKEESRPLTQSMIVVTVDPKHYKVGMLSIPRDFYVPIRGHNWGKIDLAYKYGEVQLARETVEKLFHIPIDYYAWVGLGGFKQVIDTFHGITLDINHPVLDDFYPNDGSAADPYAFKRVFISEGWHHLSGRQALEYVRSRHGDLIGDFGRSSRQQQILVQLRQKLDAMNLLRNLPSLIDELQYSIRTDLSITQLYQLQQLSRHIRPQDIRRIILQAGTYCTYGTTPDGQSILVPNWKKILPVVKTMFAPISGGVPHKRGGALHPPTETATPVKPAVTSTVAVRRARPRPSPTSTPVPSLSQLPAKLILVTNGNLVRVSRDGTVTKLTCTAGLSMPAISPDGKAVAFVRWRSFSSDIEVVKLTKGAACPAAGTALTHSESADIHNNLWAVWPAWSGDGTHILFSTDRAKLAQTPTESRAVDLGIWAMARNGGKPVQLTVPQPGAGGDTDPQWRAHFPQYLYVRWNYDQKSNTPFSQLVLRDSITKASWDLTPAGRRIYGAQIDRSGTHVVYVRDIGGQGQIETATLIRSSTGFRLANNTVLVRGKVGQPAFTPNAKWVSFMQASGDGFSLSIVNSRGGSPVRIDPAGSAVDATSRPIWVP